MAPGQLLAEALAAPRIAPGAREPGKAAERSGGTNCTRAFETLLARTRPGRWRRDLLFGFRRAGAPNVVGLAYTALDEQPAAGGERAARTRWPGGLTTRVIRWKSSSAGNAQDCVSYGP